MPLLFHLVLRGQPRQGRRAKIDAVDARMLATMAAAIEDLHPTEARSEGQRDLAELQQIRDALRKDRVPAINRGKHLRTPVGKRLNKQRLRQIERQLKLIDAEIRRRLKEQEALERRAEILTSIRTAAADVRYFAPNPRCCGPTDPDLRQRRERQIVEP